MLAFKNMNHCIDLLNNNEVVKSYNEALIKLNLLMSDIEDKIFEGIDD